MHVLLFFSFGTSGGRNADSRPVTIANKVVLLYCCLYTEVEAKKCHIVKLLF